MAYRAPASNVPELVECWQLDLEEREFKWSRNDGTMPGCQDIEELLNELNHRQKEVILAAGSAECAFHLLVSIVEAHSVPQFSRREVAVAASDLVAEALTERFGGEISGHDAEVVIDEESSLALHLRVLDEPSVYEAAHLTSTQAERIEALVHTAIPELEEKMSSKSALTGLRSGKSADPTTEGYVSWAALGPPIADIVDELDDEERCQSGRHIAKNAESHSFVNDSIEEGEEGITVVIPLGPASHKAENPVIAAMSIAALGAVCETLIGGREIGGRALRSIQVRGHRGCAVKFIQDTPCTMT